MSCLCVGTRSLSCGRVQENICPSVYTSALWFWVRVRSSVCVSVNAPSSLIVPIIQNWCVCVCVRVYRNHWTKTYHIRMYTIIGPNTGSINYAVCEYQSVHYRHQNTIQSRRHTWVDAIWNCVRSKHSRKSLKNSFPKSCRWKSWTKFRDRARDENRYTWNASGQDDDIATVNAVVYV